MTRLMVAAVVYPMVQAVLFGAGLVCALILAPGLSAQVSIPFVVVITALISVTLVVIGPRLLGEATNIVVDGVLSPGGIDFDALRTTLLLTLGLYVCSALFSFAQSYALAGLV